MKKNYDIDMQIYSLEAIMQAVSDFQEVVWIEFFDNFVTIEGDSDEEIEEVFNEFMNYVIWVMNHIS